ncbi:MAG: glycoside hydrolase family 9 protein [Ruminococcus flavefaciens]
MKDLQNRIQQMLADRKNHIRVISMVTALSLLVMFIAPMLLVSPGISLTKNSYSPVKLGNTIVRAYDGTILINTPINNSINADANYGGKTEVHDNAYSPASVSLKTLLFGDGTGTNWLTGDETLDQALAKAEDEYFLGLASDFCAFIKEDFTAHEADAEGRMAVGGNLRFEGNWNYQIGSGDYASVTPLTETEEYQGESERSGFAHVLCGGKLYRVNTISTGNAAYKKTSQEDWHVKTNGDVKTIVYDPEHDMYKKLFVDDVSDSECRGSNIDQAYSNSFSTECPGDDDANCNHTYLESVNQLAQIYNSDTIKVKDIIQKVYDDITKRSSLLSKIKGIAGHVEGNTVIFDGAGAEGNTVYFTLDKWGEDYNDPNINRVEFRNIPENANIVVNVGGKNFNIFGMNGDNRIVKTFINDTEISQTGGDIKTNNSRESGRILYNFYEATEGKIQCNFNGTVLSPLADVTTPPAGDKCPGHLSGALIANSHDGYIEFGYRPYRGGSEILGLTSGYVVPVDKIIKGTNNTPLPGARFTIEKIEDGVTSTVGGWVSGDSTKYAPLPFKVDFSGDTDYSAVKTYLETQNGSNDTQSNNVNRFSKKALVDALGGGFKADEDDDAETTTVETEETTSADTTAIETETTAAEETTAITSAADETTSSETETTEVAETTVSEVTEPVTEAEVQDETDIPDEETEVTDEEFADVQNIQNFEILADDDQSETDPSETPETTPANVFQSHFTIKESNPPEGFFGTDKQYTVDIIETINDMIVKDGKYYPDNVDVDFTISGGPNYNYQSRFNITDIRNELNMVVTRNIKVGDDTFTLTIADHKATSVLAGNSNVTPTNGKVFTYQNKDYYFDPEYMMVIPLPAKNLKFENEPGLYFKKVDDKGNPVTGATITLDPDPMISGWKQGDLINLDDIDENTVYTFTEDAAPPGYEKAEPIHFQKIGEHKIKYWTDNEEDNQTLDLQVNGNLIIEMVDKRILGAKLKIFKYRKTAEDTEEVPLEGAAFSLYAEDGTLLKPDINANNEQIDLTGITDTTYAENGYLKPGTYYLKETKTPTVGSGEDPYEYPGKLYFVVNNVFTVKAYTAPIALGIEKSENKYSISFTLTDNNVVKHIVSDEGQTNKTTIENVTSINVKCDKTIEQAYVGAVAGEGFAKNPYDKDELNLSFNPPIEVNNLKVMANNLNVTYAEIQTSDGTRYVYEPTPATNPTITASNLLSEVAPDTNGVQTLKVKNEKQGANKDVTVTKKWKNDEGFEGLRSDVTVQLYRSTEELEESKIAEELAKTENSKLTPYTPDGSDGTATLNSANNWTHKWEDLPAHSDDVNKVFYYYYVKEISTHSDYKTTYQVEGNDLTVVNTLKTININAEKQWDYPEGTIELPPSITFMLQMSDDNGSNWVDVPEKKITLTADDSWMGEFKNLPEGKQYRMKEVDVPTGWISAGLSDVSGQNNATLSITNTADLSRLNLHKDWDENDSGSVDSVKVELWRKEQSLWPENQSAEAVMEDYARLLQYSLYFYDGVMCGDQVDERSNYTWRSDCHTEDEVKGGFHDAGDHVMFGLPAGFSASTLGWSLKEYRNEFDSLGQTPHIKMIIDHYAEFFNNAVRYNEDGTVKEILVQKGHGNTDHAYWGMPEGQPSREDQMYWKSDTGSDVAAEYAAALALAYINFHDTGETKYSDYLVTAKKLYEYSRRVDKALNEENINIDETDKNQYPGYYKSNQYADDQAWAASWIAVADGNATYNGTSYKVEAKNRLTSDDINGWDWGGYHWNNVRHGAEFVLAAYLGESWDNVKNFVNSKGSDWKGDRYKYPDEWGASRYNSGFQTVALAAVHQAKNNSNVDISQADIANWCKSQMNYILGDNKYNMCFVTAFSDHSPLKVHFRAGSGAVYNMQTKDDPNIIDKAYTNDVNRLIGGMVGGSAGDSDNYEDRRTFYQRNEVASDYNAVLVGAAAGLYSYFRTGTPYEIPGVEHQYLPPTSTSQEDQTEGTANAVNPAVSMANAGKAVATTVRKLYKTGVDTNIAASTGTKTRALRLGKAEKLAGSLDSIAGVIGPRLMAVPLGNGWSQDVDSSGNEYIYYDNYALGTEIAVPAIMQNVTKIEVEATSTGVINFGFDPWIDGIKQGQQAVNVGWANGNGETTTVSGTYSFPSPITINSSVKITIGWGDATNCTLKVKIIKEPLRFKVTPAQTTIKQGNSTNLTIVNPNNSQITYKLKEQNDLGGKFTVENGQLVVVNTTPPGDYTIVATGGENESSEFTIHVDKAPPSIQLSTDSVKEGKTFVVTVSHASDNLNWLVDNNNFNDVFDKTGSNGTYTLTAKRRGTYNISVQDSDNNSATSNKVTITVTEQPTFNITPSSDYVTSNGSVDINVEGSRQITDRKIYKADKTEATGFTINQNTITVDGASAGIYTVELTDSNGAIGTCKIEVLGNGLLYEMVNVNKDEYNSAVPTDIKDFDIQRVAVKFSKKWSNNGANYGYYLNGNGVNKAENIDGKSFYSDTVDDRLIYDITVPNKPLETVSIKHWWDDSPINIDKYYYIYSIGNAIKLSADKAEALIGDEVTLTPTGNIEGLTYTITKNGDVYNNNVINNNVFTPTEHGTYVITAANSAGKTSTVTITVTGFKLDSHDVNVKKGNTVTIPITYNGENNFTFDPADSEYFDISVDDNDNVVVTGIQATAGPIPVRISRNGYSETINVNVNNGISIKDNKHEIAVNEAIQLEAENVNGSVTWTSSNTAIATVDNGKVIGKGFGTVTITATDGDGEATYQIRVDPIPKDAEFVDTITIEESQHWTAEVNNLPKVSPNGIPYVYYIKEEVSNQYIPLSYTGNGAKLGNNVPIITVTNKLTKNLPITGGRGTEKIYMAGGVMMLLAAAAYAMFKRREFGKEE